LPSKDSKIGIETARGYNAVVIDKETRIYYQNNSIGLELDTANALSLSNII